MNEQTPPRHAPASPGVVDDAFVADPRRWRILGVNLVVGFMSLLDVTVVNVALPSMREALDTSTSTVQWVVSGYALTFGLTLVAGGRLGDAYGRRRLMTLGLIGFMASSVLVGLAPNVETVILARLLQGASAGLLTPQNTGLIQDLFRGAERGRAFGMFGVTVATASALGPVIGGLIIALAGEEDGWRWLFWINVPIGLAALIGILRLTPGRRGEGRPWIDVVGAVLLGLTVLTVLWPMVLAEGGARLPLLLIPLAVPLGWAFVRWEARLRRIGRPPLLEVGLLRQVPGYADGLVIGTLYFTGFTGIFLVLSVHLQEHLGLSPLEAGLLITPFAVGSGVTSPVAGRLVSRIGRRITVWALVMMMSGIVLVALLAPGREGASLALVLVPCLLLAGIGAGGVISPNFTLTLADVPPVMGGAAGGAVQTGQRIGTAFGAALLMTAYGTGSATSAAVGLRAALVTALVLLSLALVVAIRSARAEH
ncbi:MFS transporter [Nocardioides sp. dk4132]|uniref:MFS transporter n=1 Tax=unclassified Nocardioides TaxID=2615069 RepID=UPI001294D490|nr:MULTISPECIES: MFS transporter [unclassified Nocardioides]MQW77359.1 MFS transporter [Nocardioides sp. dk4132]QGA09180.1 MFS transporter [Nocardioides sp. dk884]